MKETWVKSQRKYQGKIFSLRVGNACLEDGSIVQRDVIEHPGGVAIVAVENDNSVIMLRQFRISIGRELLELPGGRIDPGEHPEVAAKRELVEEIGYEAGLLVPVASFLPAPGFTNLRVSVYLAFNLRKAKQNLEWDEKPQLVRLSIAQLKEKLLKGELEDGNTIIGIFGLLEYLGNHS